MTSIHHPETWYTTIKIILVLSLIGGYALCAFFIKNATPMPDDFEDEQLPKPDTDENRN